MNILNQQRQDLQYYIPQLLTFLVIQCNLANKSLIKLVLRGCATDFYFAHCTYFYLKSLSMNSESVQISTVIDFLNRQFLDAMKMYSNNRLSGFELSKSLVKMDPTWSQNYLKAISENQHEIHVEQNQLIRNYGKKQYIYPKPEYPPIVEKVYNKTYHQDGFLQTPTFLNDLIQIGYSLSNIDPKNRNKYLQEAIMDNINTKLPANVYIPFLKNNIRLYTVLCVWKGKLFSTKMRAPFSIWVQLYREQQQHSKKMQKTMIQKKPQKKRQTLLNKIYENLSKPFNVSENSNTLDIKKYIVQKVANMDIKTPKKRQHYSSFVQNSQIYSNDNRLSICEVYQYRSDQKKSNKSSLCQSDKDAIQSQENDGDYFPQEYKKQVNQICKKSIYRKLSSWRVIHFMVKVGDDLKQGTNIQIIIEQFAMQLIYAFQQIFKQQQVDCIVHPYEVISLGPNQGLIQMLNDVVTLDSLFQKLNLHKMSLKQFFDSYFKNKQQAKINFMHSLAGYSLVTYFLQVKDRHNGNILLHRDGSIIHIDFGFLLSNVPGKGVQLQSKVAFKLLSQYVEVMGSLNSQMFYKFRQCFLKGFRAILKHKQIILSLVKMMYSSHGEGMACFIKGQQAIWALQRRFNPQENIQQFCYELINGSLDHWRARWYDKFQYFLQKIYY